MLLANLEKEREENAGTTPSYGLMVINVMK
jgi:hypothetical protein